MTHTDRTFESIYNIKRKEMFRNRQKKREKVFIINNKDILFDASREKKRNS